MKTIIINGVEYNLTPTVKKEMFNDLGSSTIKRIID